MNSRADPGADGPIRAVWEFPWFERAWRRGLHWKETREGAGYQVAAPWCDWG